jgi:glycine C-acetyltransferase
MTIERLDAALAAELDELRQSGRAKSPERVLEGWVPPRGDRGPRWRLRGEEGEFLRLNSNSYLSLSHRPEVLEAADEAARSYGAGPGAVRFIDGTFPPHVDLEREIARFVSKPAARIFNSAYTANLGLALAVQSKRTFWIGDELNHNCIIRGMRIAGVPREHRSIFKHNDLDELRRRLDEVPDDIRRLVVIFDGVFSMRGDAAPMAGIEEAVAPHRDRFPEGLITVVDDSHGIGAYGETGRGTEEHTGVRADVVVGTFGKAFGVNGGFVAASGDIVEAIRQRADTYIYSNPLGAADAAAAVAAVRLVDSEEGRARLRHLHERVRQLREGFARLGLESIPGPHPVVPLLIRDPHRCQELVRRLFEHRILVVGLSFPVVPRGDDLIRFQVNAAHTASDIAEALGVLEKVATPVGSG